MAENTIEKKAETISLKPSYPEFGCIGVGFIYKLTIVVCNHGEGTERLRAVCSMENEKPKVNKISSELKQIILAKGIQTTLDIELIADTVGTFCYNLKIFQSSGNLISRQIMAYILPFSKFKSLCTSLKLDNRKVYEEGVRLKKSLPLSSSEPSLKSSNSSSEYCIALLEEDELDVCE